MGGPPTRLAWQDPQAPLPSGPISREAQEKGQYILSRLDMWAVECLPSMVRTNGEHAMGAHRGLTRTHGRGGPR